MGVVNHAVEQNAEGTAAYDRALKLAEEILPQVIILFKKPYALLLMAYSVSTFVCVHAKIFPYI